MNYNHEKDFDKLDINFIIKESLEIEEMNEIHEIDFRDSRIIRFFDENDKFHSISIDKRKLEFFEIFSDKSFQRIY
jgi:hypothetical protein